MRAIIAHAQPPLTTLCIDAAGIADIDYTGIETMREAISNAQQQGVSVVFAEVGDNVREQLERSGIVGRVGEDAI
jgi:SulP family sulfate permease